MISEYPRSHVLRIMVLDSLTFLIGLALLVAPFVLGWSPGSIDTTSHVALGALIATLAIFRVLLAYGAVWIEVLLFVLGLITFRMPQIMFMVWDEHYHVGHHAAGAAIMALSVISGALSASILNKLSAQH